MQVDEKREPNTDDYLTLEIILMTPSTLPSLLTRVLSVLYVPKVF